MLPENVISRRHERGEGIPLEASVYDEGWMAAQAAFEKTGSIDVNPSLVNVADFGHDWQNFMDGWSDAMADRTRRKVRA